MGSIPIVSTKFPQVTALRLGQVRRATTLHFAKWLEDDSGWNAPPTSRLASFIAELESSFPGLEDEAEADLSPWASWPVLETLAHGRGNAFNIRWSKAESMSDQFRVRCQAAGLTLYDQQEGVLIRPEPARNSRRSGRFGGGGDGKLDRNLSPDSWPERAFATTIVSCRRPEKEDVPVLSSPEPLVVGSS